MEIVVGVGDHGLNFCWRKIPRREVSEVINSTQAW